MMDVNKGWQCPICERVYSPSTPICFSCNNKQVTDCIDENLVPFDKVCEYLNSHLWTNSDPDGDPIVESVANITKEDFIKDLRRFIEYGRDSHKDKNM